MGNGTLLWQQETTSRSFARLLHRLCLNRSKILVWKRVWKYPEAKEPKATRKGMALQATSYCRAIPLRVAFVMRVASAPQTGISLSPPSTKLAHRDKIVTTYRHMWPEVDPNYKKRRKQRWHQKKRIAPPYLRRMKRGCFILWSSATR